MTGRRLHEREMMVEVAAAELRYEVSKLTARICADLTDGERLRVYAELSNNLLAWLARSMIRAERHPDDPDMPGGFAADQREDPPPYRPRSAQERVAACRICDAKGIARVPGGPAATVDDPFTDLLCAHPTAGQPVLEPDRGDGRARGVTQGWADAHPEGPPDFLG